MNNFPVQKKIADGLYVIRVGECGDPAMWTLRRLRKQSKCVATGKRLEKGEQHYGPIGNMDYRGWRIHREYVEQQV